MIQLTDSAVTAVRTAIAGAGQEVEGLRIMVEAGGCAGLKYMMAETSYYRPETIAARDLFAEGRFGELFYSELEYYHPMSAQERDSYFFYFVFGPGDYR